MRIFLLRTKSLSGMYRRDKSIISQLESNKNSEKVAEDKDSKPRNTNENSSSKKEVKRNPSRVADMISVFSNAPKQKVKVKSAEKEKSVEENDKREDTKEDTVPVVIVPQKNEGKKMKIVDTNNIQASEQPTTTFDETEQKIREKITPEVPIPTAGSGNVTELSKSNTASLELTKNKAEDSEPLKSDATDLKTDLAHTDISSEVKTSENSDKIIVQEDKQISEESITNEESNQEIKGSNNQPKKSTIAPEIVKPTVVVQDTTMLPALLKSLTEVRENHEKKKEDPKKIDPALTSSIAPLISELPASPIKRPTPRVRMTSSNSDSKPKARPRSFNKVDVKPKIESKSAEELNPFALNDDEIDHPGTLGVVENNKTTKNQIENKPEINKVIEPLNPFEMEEEEEEEEEKGSSEQKLSDVGNHGDVGEKTEIKKSTNPFDVDLEEEDEKEEEEDGKNPFDMEESDEDGRNPFEIEEETPEMNSYDESLNPFGLDEDAGSDPTDEDVKIGNRDVGHPIATLDQKMKINAVKKPLDAPKPPTRKKAPAPPPPKPPAEEKQLQPITLPPVAPPRHSPVTTKRRAPNWKSDVEKKMEEMNTNNTVDKKFIHSPETKKTSPLPTKAGAKQTPNKSKPPIIKPARPAPGYGFPLIKRSVKWEMTEEEVVSEMAILDVQLKDLEKKGVKLEEVLRDEMELESGNEVKTETDQLLREWFDLVHDKNKLVRRETDLVYLMQQQRLEQEHADVEYKIRKLLNKPDGEKTEEEKEEESNLLDQLVQVVERRNVIINSIEEARVKEEEEDAAYDRMKIQMDSPPDNDNSKMKKKKNKVKKMFSKKKKSSKHDAEPTEQTSNT
uniref:MICAL-like protein 1 isoform X2 n=1 Tax=Ciona intestinalis TaxID=7719 RepID=UPI000EF54E06|nr:MICAL-like protein 1 isoform X2 [Ciona intestinalis]|eukprot:XP_026691128.1 MICAL-like protein 1 isoform X2 [Ciona intestinalis]